MHPAKRTGTMAYNKLVASIELAMELQASSTGLTIKQMMERTDRSRKTVERMLAGLNGLGLEPQLSLVEGDHHLTKRWHLDGIPFAFLTLAPAERSALERHARMMPKGTARAGLTKLLAERKPLSKHLAIDQEILIERAAHIGKVGPRNKVDEELMSILETALTGFEEIRLLYQAATRPTATWRTARPLGLVFSRFGYLVASSRNRPPITYRLDLIREARPTGTYFRSKSNWNFKNWVSESFGVFHGDTSLAVTLRFNSRVAKRADSIEFHPSQRTTKRKDGSLVIQLTCQGHQELIHELCHPDWLGNVVIEAPETLKSEYLHYVEVLKEAVR